MDWEESIKDTTQELKEVLRATFVIFCTHMISGTKNTILIIVAKMIEKSFFQLKILWKNNNFKE